VTDLGLAFVGAILGGAVGFMILYTYVRHSMIPRTMAFFRDTGIRGFGVDGEPILAGARERASDAIERAMGCTALFLESLSIEQQREMDNILRPEQIGLLSDLVVLIGARMQVVIDPASPEPGEVRPS
jgi:hypothetical protein